MSKYETHFEAVKNNQEKAVTYREQIKRYNIALKNEFYIEAGMIAYAMLEDRLKAFLYYIGAIRTIEADKLNVDKTKKTLKNIYFGSEEAARNKRLDINKISIKQSIIRKTLAWTENCIGTPENQYLAALKKEYEGRVDLGGLLDTLSEIDVWTKERNELVHGLMNKRVDVLSDKLCLHAKEGMEYVRFVDSQVKSLKSSNTIRKKMKIKD